MVYCSHCHQYLAAGTTQCSSCGRKITIVATGVTQRLQPLSPPCLRCGSAMEQGFTLDLQGRGSYNSREQWVEGVPKGSIWLGGLDVSRQRVLPVQTYRCVQCGYLESYALPDE